MPKIERPRIWPESAFGWITVPTSATARKSVISYLPVSVSTTTSAKLATYENDWPSRGYLSFAAATSPCPANAAIDAFVTLFTSSGGSCPSYLPPSSIACCAACASVIPPPPPLRKTRSFATSYCSGLPPSFLAAISCSFCLPSIAAACAARVIACVVWLPPETQVQGRFLDVLPQVTSHFSHGTFRISATTRCTSRRDSVPKFPTPDWMAMRPSGLITNRPSNPIDPPTKQLEETPTPRTMVPLRFGRARRSFHWNCSAPRSKASFRNALVECPRVPFLTGPTGDLPSGQFTFRIST